MTWLDIILEAMFSLGGKAKYSDLYKFIEKNFPYKLSEKPAFKATIRKTIEIHSSASDLFSGKSFFEPVNNKGNGYWQINKKIIEDYKKKS